MAPVGGLLALYMTGTYFRVSSGVGFLALFSVSVQTGVIMLEYINQLRARGYTVADAAVEGAVLRLRPIMMTMLVATLGLLPAATSHAIGSDSQRPLCHCHCGGTRGSSRDERLPAAHVVTSGSHERVTRCRNRRRRRPLNTNLVLLLMHIRIVLRQTRVFVCGLALALTVLPALAQQPLDWDQLKAKSSSPTIRH